MPTRTLLLALGITSAALPAQADTITTTTATDMAWETTSEGVAFAALHGERWSEAYMAMVRLPGGLISPAHTKSADMFGLIVEGRMTHVAAGTDPMGAEVLEPGAYYHIPAGLPHVSSCISATPCVTFLYQDGAFDFLPVAQ